MALGDKDFFIVSVDILISPNNRKHKARIQSFVGGGLNPPTPDVYLTRCEHDTTPDNRYRNKQTTKK